MSRLQLLSALLACVMLLLLQPSAASAAQNVRLVLCVAPDSALAARARGQLVDLPVDLIFAQQPTGELHEQRAQAQRYAQRFEAPLVAWLNDSPAPQLAVWHAAPKRLELRPLPARANPDQPALVSARLESVALLLRSVIRSEQLLRAVSTPPPAPALAPSPPAAALRVVGFVDASLRVDGAGGIGEPWISLGTQFVLEPWSFSVGGAWLPVRELQLPWVDTTVSGLRLFGQLGHVIGRFRHTELTAQLRVGWRRSVRRTRSTATDVVGLPDRVSDAALVAGQLELSHSLGLLSLRLHLGLDTVLPTRRYQVVDLQTNQTHSAEPWRVAPTLGFGTGVSF